MSETQQFYLERAAEAGQRAAAEPLANARDRHLVAEASWSGLAVRAGRVRALYLARLAEAEQKRSS